MAEPFKEAKSGNYFVSVAYKGKRYKRSTGSPDLARARRAQRILDGKVEQLKAGLAQVPEGVPVRDFIFYDKAKPDEDSKSPDLSSLIDDYLNEAAPPNKAQSTFMTEKVHLGHLGRFADEKKKSDLASLNRDFFEAYKRWRHAAEATNVTINKELGTFRTMMNCAVRSKRTQDNPLKAVKWLKEDALFERFRTGDEIESLLSEGNHSDDEEAQIRRYRYLTAEETETLLAMAEGTEIYAFIATAAYTGMRFSEILRLKWSDVDFRNGQILARGHKGSTRERETPRHIPMHENLPAILKQHKTNHKGALLFADGDGKPWSKDFCYYQLIKLTDGTPFEGIRFHCFRHSFASNLAAQGVDQRIIDSFMGHQTEAMRKRYQHLFPEKRQEAINKLGF